MTNITLLKRFSKFSLIATDMDEEAVVPNEYLVQTGGRWTLLKEVGQPMGDENVFEQVERSVPGWLSGQGLRN